MRPSGLACDARKRATGAPNFVGVLGIGAYFFEGGFGVAPVSFGAGDVVQEFERGHVVGGLHEEFAQDSPRAVWLFELVDEDVRVFEESRAFSFGVVEVGRELFDGFDGFTPPSLFDEEVCLHGECVEIGGRLGDEAGKGEGGGGDIVELVSLERGLFSEDLELSGAFGHRRDGVRIDPGEGFVPIERWQELLAHLNGRHTCGIVGEQPREAGDGLFGFVQGVGPQLGGPESITDAVFGGR